jgi:hypothetical protein
MTEWINLGFDGLSIPAGSHLCALFRGMTERHQIMMPFLAEGLCAGDKCNCIIDDGVDGVRLALGSDADWIDIRSSKETYLRYGTFSTQAMLDFWDDSVGAALKEEGYPIVRSVGETTWTLEELPGLNDFLSYEAELNRFLPRTRRSSLASTTSTASTARCWSTLSKPTRRCASAAPSSKTCTTSNRKSSSPARNDRGARHSYGDVTGRDVLSSVTASQSL